MKIEVSNSQRMALCTLIAEYMRTPDATEVFFDCSTDPPMETATPDLLNLFMAVPATVEDDDDFNPISVADKKPDEEISVLALSDLDGWTVAYLEDDTWFEVSTGDRITVLKWMHLPPGET